MKLEEYVSLMDTERFGFKIAKVNEFNFDIREILSFLKENSVELVISKVNANDLLLINKLEDEGFRIKDIQVTYKYDLKDYKINRNHDNPNIIIRNAEISDVGNLEAIALESFKNYGHYSADNKLDKDKCNDIYKDWINRSVNNAKVADKIIVAEVDKEVAGFLSFKKNEKPPFYSAGVLGAVSKKFRNQNLFRMINIEGLNYGKEEGLEWIEHNVLITNLPVNKAYTNLGFSVYRSFITMHVWL